MSSLKQNTTEWLELRKTKIGASDVPIILGISPFKTALTLWKEKMGLLPNIQTSAMRRGHEMEGEALKSYNQKTGNLCLPKVVLHPEHDFLMASLDGLSFEGMMQVEIKCPGQKDHDLAKKGEIPPYYYAQIQAQLACTGNPRADYYSYREGEGILIPVDRDDDFIETMYPKLEEFYTCMVNKTPPEATEKDVEVRLDEEFVLKAAELAETKEQIKQLKDLEKRQIGELQIVTDGQSCEGGGYRFVKYEKQGAIDYSSIPELEGVDLEKYRKPSSFSWRFSCSS